VVGPPIRPDWRQLFIRGQRLELVERFGGGPSSCANSSSCCEGGQAIDGEVWRYGQHAPLSAANVGRLAHWADRAGKQDGRPLMPFGLGLAVTAGRPYRLGFGPSSGELNCRGSFFQRPDGHRAVSRHSGVSAPSCYLLAVDLGTLALRAGRKRSSVHVR
jgi:hypothetical protein